MNNEVKTAEYRVWHEESTNTIYVEGTLRLSGTEAYQPIQDLMEGVLANDPPELILDLKKLEFLNSSGINLLAKFTIFARKKGSVPLTVKGSKKIPWQSKSLPNLQKLYPPLKLEIE